MDGIRFGKIEKGTEYHSDLQKSFTEKINNNDGVSDALLQNAAATLSITALSEEELEKTRQSWDNHPVSHLYRNDIPINKNENGVYKIGRVEFSGKEYEDARNLISDVTSQLKDGFLSYRDYAKMTLAEKTVDTLASERFTEEQAQIISRAIRDYNNVIVKKQTDMLNGRDVTRNDNPESGKYFGVQVSISKEARELFNMSSNLQYAGTDIATNQELIDTLRNRIRNLDITDDDKVNEFRAFYRNTMKPVYSTQYPFQRSADVEDVISRDVEELMKFIEYARDQQGK